MITGELSTKRCGRPGSKIHCLTCRQASLVDVTNFKGSSLALTVLDSSAHGKPLEGWFNLALAIRKFWHRRPQESPPNKFTNLCFVHQDVLPRNLILHPSGQLWPIDWGNVGMCPPALERGALC